GRLALTQAPVNLRRVVAGGRAEEARPVVDGPALGIGRRVIEPAQAGERDRARAHRAWLERHIEIAADKPFRSDPGGGLAEGDHFRVSGRIAKLSRAVSGARDHYALANKRGPNRRFAATLGRPRLGEGAAHRIVSVLFDQIHASRAALPFRLLAWRFSLAARSVRA